MQKDRFIFLRYLTIVKEKQANRVQMSDTNLH